MGRSERRRALEEYVTGLLLEGERKSIEPMAARLVEDEARVDAMRQRLQCPQPRRTSSIIRKH